MSKPPHKNGFYIDITCPGCGGELELQRDFFSLTCTYCGSALRVVMPEVPPAYIIKGRKKSREIQFAVDRYLKENKLPLTSAEFSLKRIYFPYWKVDAVRLQIKEEIKENTNGQTDNPLTTNIEYGGYFTMGRALGSSLTSQATSEPESKISAGLMPYMATMTAGPHIEGIPESIGMRAEYIKVKPLTAEDTEDDSEFVSITNDWNATKAGMYKTAAMRGRAYGIGSQNRSELFRPEGCIIYFPFIIAESRGIGEVFRFVVDGITGRILHMSAQDDFDSVALEFAPSLVQFGQLDVKLHRCHNCGVDLPADKSSVYICHNCGEAVSIDKDFRLARGVMRAGTEIKPSTEDVLLPFWSFRLSPEVISKLIIPVGLKKSGDRLMIPGFRMSNFESMRKLSRRMTAVESSLSQEHVTGYDHRFMPANVGLSEAQIMADVVLFCSQVMKNPGLKSIDFAITPDDVDLVYAPFRPDHYFYVDAVTGSVTFEKGAIA